MVLCPAIALSCAKDSPLQPRKTKEKTMFFKTLGERLKLHLPFRMAVGKIGIWLMKVGRYLQVEYANWNREFRMKGETNEWWLMLHVSEAITSCQTVTFHSKNTNLEYKPPFVDALFDIKGVKEVIIRPYEISIKRAEVFTWDELRPEIERVILEHLMTKDKAA